MGSPGKQQGAAAQPEPFEVVLEVALIQPFSSLKDTRQTARTAGPGVPVGLQPLLRLVPIL